MGPIPIVGDQSVSHEPEDRRWQEPVGRDKFLMHINEQYVESLKCPGKIMSPGP